MGGSPIIGGLVDWWLGADDCWFDKSHGLGHGDYDGCRRSLTITGLLMLSRTGR
ncbi:hypothetical protein [Vulcanisaeta distributa]|uniref:hypothetical protein n=1 Tax=Vulcanisaeta distributa TaxID=164451 RepID=UPI001FB47AB3|nr:hypothetical protein [Vulcanisaeta distributa]